MSEIEIACTQYGDLKGTVSIDGYNGSFVHAVAAKSDMPPGYPGGAGERLAGLWEFNSEFFGNDRRF
jgi:hypothetical protein